MIAGLNWRASVRLSGVRGDGEHGGGVSVGEAGSGSLEAGEMA